MSHKYFRDRVTVAVSGAVEAAKTAAHIDHPGMRGAAREIALKQLFAPLLPQDVAIGSGKIVDATGGSSAQVDLVFYSPRLLPPMLYSADEGVFPIEACLFAIEVKSVVNSTEVASTIKKAERLRTLQLSSGNTLLDAGRAVHMLLFGFQSDLSAGGKSELDRYRELDGQSEHDPLVTGLCVAGRGYWVFSKIADPPRWLTADRQVAHDEVVDFLAGVVNSIPVKLVERGYPELGKYLLDEKPFNEV